MQQRFVTEEGKEQVTLGVQEKRASDSLSADGHSGSKKAVVKPESAPCHKAAEASLRKTHAGHVMDTPTTFEEGKDGIHLECECRSKNNCYPWHLPADMHPGLLVGVKEVQASGKQDGDEQDRSG